MKVLTTMSKEARRMFWLSLFFIHIKFVNLLLLLLLVMVVCFFLHYNVIIISQAFSCGAKYLKRQL